MKKFKAPFLIGLFTYCALLVLAIFFYKERTIFIDIAFHLFEIIRNKSYAIQNNRFGAFFTQSFPLVASSLGVPLKGVLLSYSTGFILYYFAIFLVCFLIFKQPELALAMLLFNILIVGDTFYWIQSELPQALAFTIFFFAALKWRSQKENINPFIDSLLGIMVFTLAFFHPLLPIVFIFLVGFYLLSNPSGRFKKILYNYLLLFLGIVLIKSRFFKTQYDSQAMDGIKNFSKFFPDYITLESNSKFLRHLLTDYYLLPVFLLLILWLYVKQKKYLKLLLVLSFFFGYLLLVNISYPQGADQFYLENLYLPLSIFLIVAFVYDVLPAFSQKHVIAGLTIIASLQIFHIYYSSGKYEQRLQWAKQFLKETEELEQSKVLVSEKHVPKDVAIMTWASSYEFWLLSTLETGKTSSILILENPDELQWALPGKNQFITKWGVFDYDKLPSKYFNLKDSTAYQVLR